MSVPIKLLKGDTMNNSALIINGSNPKLNAAANNMNQTNFPKVWGLLPNQFVSPIINDTNKNLNFNKFDILSHNGSMTSINMNSHKSESILGGNSSFREEENVSFSYENKKSLSLTNSKTALNENNKNQTPEMQMTNSLKDMSTKYNYFNKNNFNKTMAFNAPLINVSPSIIPQGYNHIKSNSHSNLNISNSDRPVIINNQNNNLENNRNNFFICNFQIFMTNTTPVIYDCEMLTIKKFFDSFNNASTYGVECFYKSFPSINNSNKTDNSVIYYPSLSALYLESSLHPSSSMSHAHSEKHFNVENNDQFQEIDRLKLTNLSVSKKLNINPLSGHNSTSSLESFFSLDDFNKGGCNRKQSGNILKLQFYEDSNIYNRPILNTRTDEIFSGNPDIESLSFSEINEKSWFSILWTPKEECYGATSESFLVLYRFRNKYLTNSLKSLTVMGILANKIDETNQAFWFGKYL